MGSFRGERESFEGDLRERLYNSRDYLESGSLRSTISKSKVQNQNQKIWFGHVLSLVSP